MVVTAEAHCRRLLGLFNFEFFSLLDELDERDELTCNSSRTIITSILVLSSDANEIRNAFCFRAMMYDLELAFYIAW